MGLVLKFLCLSWAKTHNYLRFKHKKIGEERCKAKTKLKQILTPQCVYIQNPIHVIQSNNNLITISESHQRKLINKLTRTNQPSKGQGFN